MFIVENIVPGPQQPDFSKLFDIHMMVALTGRERREEEILRAARYFRLEARKNLDSTGHDVVRYRER